MDGGDSEFLLNCSPNWDVSEGKSGYLIAWVVYAVPGVLGLC
jgi:hypothetical protein